MIENKSIYKKYEEIKNRLQNPYETYEFSSSDLLNPNSKLRIELNTYNEQLQKIKDEFCSELIQEYNTNQDTINTAEEFMDRSDNGWSFNDLETYVIMLINYVNEQENIKNSIKNIREV